MALPSFVERSSKKTLGVGETACKEGVKTLPKPERKIKELEKPLGKRTEETEEIKKISKTPEEKVASLTGPEAFVMLSFAIMLDLIGLVVFILDFIFGVGLIVSFVPDVIGLIFIGGWMFFRTGHITITRKAKKTIKKGGKKILKRLGLAFLGELIPVFGDVAFCWTLAVYFELKNN